MSKISIDTTKLKASGESIVSIAEEFNSIIEDIFTKLKSMDTNGTWTGDSEDSAVKKYSNLDFETDVILQIVFLY